MAKKKKRKPKLDQVSLMKSVRRTWEISPVTRVVPNKKNIIPRKRKYKEDLS